MKQRKFNQWLWLTIISLITMVGAPGQLFAQEEVVEIPEITAQEVTDEIDGPDVTIVHTNDMHGRIESTDRELGMSKVKAFVEQENPDLVLDAGDAFQGLPISNSDQGETMAELMNQVGYDAMAVGNHEFDFGYDQALAYQELLDFPLLSANVYKDGERVFQPFTTVEKNGRNFGIVGLSTPETLTKTHPKNVEGLTFRNPIAEGLDQFEALQSLNVDTYIYLVHLGIDSETNPQWRGDSLAKVLADRHPLAQILVIDGHSHTKESMRFNNVTYSQTGAHLANVGKLTLKGQGKDYQADAKYFSVEDLNELNTHAVTDQMIGSAKERYEKANAEVIIKNNPIHFAGERDDVRRRETNLGNLLADIVYEYGQTGFSNPTDLAVMNGGGIRVSITNEVVTKGDIIAVSPFGNTIAQIEVTGHQLYDMFEHALRTDVEFDEKGKVVLDSNGLPTLGANGGFLQVSKSVLLHFDALKEPGRRVWDLKILNPATGQFNTVRLNDKYYLATNDFLAAGGDGYTMLGGLREEGPSMDDVVLTYLKQMSLEDLKAYSKPYPNQRLMYKVQTATEQTPDVELQEQETQTEEILWQKPAYQLLAEERDAAATLPETGENPTIWLGVLSLLAGLGLMVHRRRIFS
ncbi:bifunctional metallophosphatase/5'-nucleotidase [Dolosicoccus paucivorans]|uniref:Bifunctional metallophosphatase/5'-nucleotidase n=1 Tax=Dolosicoccus paucivorans TaxID=84521 RepID=A0A2N6SKV0_9LACT|nr:5'-nucleotidase C-terminal domain-containing protein [Dolosicoccus paucivorans]PMB83760.1 bifunctional metallophosphatase/5'-nucleotidase [Dolosicoccus paucivorans]PMC57163.1 bifunctional metallophosphatase/5'-nucleotidase [Dolosicoccus paucivorans]